MGNLENLVEKDSSSSKRTRALEESVSITEKSVHCSWSDEETVESWFLLRINKPLMWDLKVQKEQK